ncbi:hypothetical protein C3V38_09670 [Dietzia sp. oral taxon 368]|nr:hypothetical protein C3V38_09670 [Dietzia sp. oral taxon 368]
MLISGQPLLEMAPRPRPCSPPWNTRCSGAIQSGLATASSAVGIDPAAFMEQFQVPIAFSLMSLGVDNLILRQLGI